MRSVLGDTCSRIQGGCGRSLSISNSSAAELRETKQMWQKTNNWGSTWRLWEYFFYYFCNFPISLKYFKIKSWGKGGFKKGKGKNHGLIHWLLQLIDVRLRTIKGQSCSPERGGHEEGNGGLEVRNSLAASSRWKHGTILPRNYCQLSQSKAHSLLTSLWIKRKRNHPNINVNVN